MKDPIEFCNGDRVKVTIGGRVYDAEVTEASSIGRAVMVTTDGAFRMPSGGLYLNDMPVYYRAGQYVDLLRGDELTIERDNDQ